MQRDYALLGPYEEDPDDDLEDPDDDLEDPDDDLDDLPVVEYEYGGSPVGDDREDTAGLPFALDDADYAALAPDD